MRYICEQFVKVINFEHIVSLKKKKKGKGKGRIFVSNHFLSLSLSLTKHKKTCMYHIHFISQNIHMYHIHLIWSLDVRIM